MHRCAACQCSSTSWWRDHHQPVWWWCNNWLLVPRLLHDVTMHRLQVANGEPHIGKHTHANKAAHQRCQRARVEAAACHHPGADIKLDKTTLGRPAGRRANPWREYGFAARTGTGGTGSCLAAPRRVSCAWVGASVPQAYQSVMRAHTLRCRCSHLFGGVRKGAQTERGAGNIQARCVRRVA